jgi:phage tail-like protein
MQAQERRFWLLSGRTDPRAGGRAGWQVGPDLAGVAVSQTEIGLAVDPDGPLSLGWRDDSLGGLMLPKGMALDGDGTLCLLDESGCAVLRFDPTQRRFAPLPTIGGRGTEARQLLKPVSIACLGDDLYIAEQGNRRVQVFGLPTLTLRHIWTLDDWRPVDLAVHDRAVYILDAQGGRIFRHPAGDDELRPVYRLLGKNRTWLRLAVDRAGQQYVLYSESGLLQLATYDPQGKRPGRVEDPGDVRDRFDPPVIRLFYPSGDTPRAQGRFCLPPGLQRLCERGAEPAALEHPLAACVAPPPLTSEADLEWRSGDLRDAERLARRWQEACDRVSGFIRAGLDQKTRDVLDAWQDDPLPNNLKYRLLWELNRLLGRPALFNRQAWVVVKLRPETLALLTATPSGIERVRLNRMLLEDAYVDELARSAYTAPAPLVFYRTGQAATWDASEPAGLPYYCRTGYWITRALDSQIYHCQWHRIELDLARLPAGSQVIVKTFTSDTGGEPPAADEPAWQPAAVFTGEMQQSSAAEGITPAAPYECLVQSREGRYLYLKIELRGDGYSSPAVAGIRIHYPRASYLEYLPAIYRTEEQSRFFLERFLSIFQTEWDELERRLDDIPALFDPAAVPGEGGFLEQLAGWLALPLEMTWTPVQKRVLLQAFPQILRQRGTVKGVTAYLRAYLRNITGLSTEEMDCYENFPLLVEGFRARRRLTLSQEKGAELTLGGRLWGPGEVGRLQLGVFAQAGEVRLVSTGDPQLDPLEFYAHRFQVYLPAAWVRTAEDERMLRRALDTETPAQAAYDLCLVEPRFRVGIQSTVGIDTIVGGYPQARLAGRDENWAPSLPPRGRLGCDTILTGGPAEPFKITARTRVGIDTTLL